MIAPTDAELQFGSTHAPVGFTSAQVSQFDGSAEPVVRELIQNCLDAADRARCSAVVRFIITYISTKELPGYIEYCQAFKEAKSERQRRDTTASHDERMIIQRIDELISCEQIPILLCVDNGCGLNPKQMISLLTVGNTDKGDGGAGSFGLGHHAAFGASDLRYVLYGSRYSLNDQKHTISSGHTILATRTDRNGQLLAPEGYWRRTEWKEQAWQDGSEFPTEVPTLLASHLPETETGTVVAITGFNNFRLDDNDPLAEDQIMQVAAANFCAAIDAGQLKVEIIGREGRNLVTERATVTSALEKIADRKRASQTGQISGAQAHAAWLTLCKGAELIPTPLPGVQVKWRHLEAARGESTQVHLFRKGMWISSRVDHLLKSNFTSTWPFDAVINLTGGELEGLVRASEGPEHRGIKRQRLDNNQKQQLRKCLITVAQALRVAIGQRNDEEEYIPESFAILDGHRIRKAEAIRRPRHRGGGRQNRDVIQGKKKGSGSEGERHQGRPRPGSIPRYRHVLQSSTDAGIIAVGLHYEEDTKDQHIMGIRVLRTSGADGTCDDPLPDDYLPLVSVLDSENRLVNAASKNGELELEIPAIPGERTLLIELAGSKAHELSAVPHLLSIDIVKRARPSSPNSDTNEEAEITPTTELDKHCASSEDQA